MKIFFESKNYQTHNSNKEHTIIQFLNDNLKLVDSYETIPINVLYQAYVNWSSKFEQSSSLIKINSFIKILRKNQKNFNFALSNDKKRFSRYKYKFSICHKLNVNPNKMSYQQYYLMMNNKN